MALHDMCQTWAHDLCWSLAVRIDVSQAVVDVGMPSLTDAEQEPIARFGRSSYAIGQTLSLVGGQTAEPCASQS